MRYGLSEKEVRDIIQRQLDKNPDLKYYINNPYFEEFVSLLIDGVSSAIVKNNESFIRDMNRDLRMHG